MEKGREGREGSSGEREVRERREKWMEKKSTQYKKLFYQRGEE